MRTRVSRRLLAKKLTISGVHHMLRNRTAWASCRRGVYHDGKHEAIVSPEPWLRVREVLDGCQDRARPSTVFTRSFVCVPGRKRAVGGAVRQGLRMIDLVRPAGFEPATLGLEVPCSIR